MPFVEPQTRGDVTHSAATWSVIEDSWRAGDLSYLLDQTQLEIHAFVLDSVAGLVFVSAARQLGKSFQNCVLALETCIANPGKRVNYIGKTFGSLKKMMEESMLLIVEHAPPELKPVFLESKSRWVFPYDGPARGAYIQLVGADEIRGADRARGGSVVLNIIDEAGFIDCLQYLLEAVIKPMGRRTFAKTVLTTSPALTPDHYSCKVEDRCITNGAAIMRDYWAPGVSSWEDKQRFLEREAKDANLTVEQFMLTTIFRREYMCERVIETSLAVIPEWPGARVAILEAGRVAVRPPFWDLYVAGDPGMDDLTGILFAYADFRRSRLVIEHELLLTKANTQTIADAMGELMREHYPAQPDETRSVKLKALRLVSKEDFAFVVLPYSATFDDAGKRLCADMFQYHGLQFSPYTETDREASLNVVRLEVQQRHIEIHPRCVNLVRQLGAAIRTKPGGDMARSDTDGHFDLIAALRQLVRRWNKTRNPYPADYGFDPNTQARRDPIRRGKSLADVIAGR